MDERTKTEWRHSLWILWTFTVLFNYFAFFWIGYTAKRRKWILSGCIYLAAWAISYFIYRMGDVEIYREFLLSDVIISGFGAVAIIHALWVRKAYLIRIGIMEDIPKPRRRLKRTKVNRTAGPRRLDDGVTDITYPIDLNKCTEGEFASLPGITVVRAKRAVMIRAEREGFDSVDDFLDSLNVEQHFAVQIGKLAKVSKFVPPPVTAAKGRKVDL